MGCTKQNNMNKTILCLAIAIVGGAASALAVPTTLARPLKSAGGKPAVGKSAAGKAVQPAAGITDTTPVSPGSSVTPTSTAGVDDNGRFLSGVSTVLSLTPSAGAGSGWNGDWGIDVFSATLQSTSVPLNMTHKGTPVTFVGLDPISQGPLVSVVTNDGGKSNVPPAHFDAVNPLSALDSKDHTVPSVASVSGSGVASGLSGTSASGVASIPRVTSVPDGGTTVALLGIGFICLAGLHRRFAF